MPKLLSQLNHEEAKMNSELQCRKQKKENKQGCEIFTICKISQVANFPFPALYLSFQPLFMFSAFDFFTSFSHFLVFFPFCSL